MPADYGETVRLEPDESNFGEEFQPEKKNNKTIWIIVAVVAAILICCCLAVVLGAVWLWNNGDSLFDEWSLAVPIINLLLS